MPRTGVERRKHPRAPGRTGLRMRAGEVECSVVDVSCSGLCFRTPEPPPEMSLLEIRLEVPPATPDLPRDVVRCQGAVVRAEPLEGGNHEVAVFFTRLGDEGRLALMDYVRRHS